MKGALLTSALVICIALLACHKVEYTEAWFNETCQNLGYDTAVPVYWDDVPAGTNCCKRMGDKVVCDEFYFVDETRERFL